MLTVVFENHRIEIDLAPNRIIYFDGKEISTKPASKTAPSHHDFSIMEDDEEINYEILIKPFFTTMLTPNGFFEIKRQSKLLFSFYDSGFTDGVQLKVVHLNITLELNNKNKNKIFFNNDIILEDKQFYNMNYTFTINEGKENIYDLKSWHPWKDCYSLSRNGKLLFRIDQTKDRINIQAEKEALKEERMENAEVYGKFIGHAANAFTDGAGSEAGIAIKSVSKSISKVSDGLYKK